MDYFEGPIILYYGWDSFEVESALFAVHLPSASVPSSHSVDWVRLKVAEMSSYSRIEHVVIAFG